MNFKNNKNPLSQARKFSQDDFKNTETEEEDRYDNFLRKFQVNSVAQESTNYQESKQAQGISNYSNFIEKKNMENNLSFSNNAVEIEQDLSSEEGIQNLEDIDTNYDAYAERELENEYAKSRIESNLNYTGNNEETVQKEDRVRQIPQNFNDKNDKFDLKIDQEIQKIEKEILKADQRNSSREIKRAQFSHGKNKSRNRFAESGSQSVAQLYTQRDHYYNYSKSFLEGEDDLSSKSLIDIKTSSKYSKFKKNQRPNSSKRRPLSSRTKRSYLPHKNTHNPMVEGEILLKITVKLTEDSVHIMNVYKGDTSYSVAER